MAEPIQQPEQINSLELPLKVGTTDAQFKAQEDAVKADTPSFIEGLKMARDLDAGLPAIKRIIRNQQYEWDENFRFTPESWDQVTEGIDPEYHDQLTGARNKDHLQDIRRRILQEQEANRKIGNMGFSGLGAHLLASVFDETALAATIASEGVLAPLILAQKATRLGKVGRAALVGGATNAAFEAGVDAGNETHDPMAILYAGALGAALGPLAFKGRYGASGVNPSPEATQALNSIARDIESNLKDSTGARRTTVQPGLPHDLDVDDEIAKMAYHKSALTDPLGIFDGDGFVNKAGQVVSSFLGKALDKTRFSLAATMKGSDSLVERFIGKNYIEDSVEGGEISAALIQHTEFNQLMGRYAAIRNNAFKQWKIENHKNGNPLNIFDESRAWEQFEKEVSRNVRGEASASKHIKAVADEITEGNKKVLRMLKEAGVEGFEEVSENENYLMRMWNSKKFRELNTKFGEEQTVGLIHGAIRSANPDFDEALTAKVSKAIFKRFLLNPKGVDGSLQRLFGGEGYDDLEEFLMGLEVRGSDAKAVDEFLTKVRQEIKDGKKDGVSNRAKRRVLLDEGYAHDMHDGSGNIFKTRVSELFSENADLLHTSYLRQMTGRYAMAKKGVRSDTDWNELKRRYDDESVANGWDEGTYKRGLERMDFVRNSLLGRPTGEDFSSKTSNVLRVLRDSNFIRIMNQAGFAQLPELGAVVSQAGFRSVLSHVPEMKTFMKQLVNGEMTPSDPLFKEIEDFIGGFGINRALHIPHTRMEEFGQGGNFGNGWFAKGMETVDLAQQYGKKWTSNISAMGPITEVMEKLAVVSMSQKFLNMALDPTTVNKARMASLGLSDKMLERVLKQIQKHAKDEPNAVTGRKLKSMNFQDWTDHEAFEAYRYAMNRQVARVVQQNLLGESHPLMSTAWGKTLGQFRSFVMVAYEKQLMHNLLMRDKETVTYALTGTMLGGLAYALQTTVNSIGRDDAEQFRKERLSPGNIGAAAFQRSGMATLIPGTVDSLLGLTGRDPFFGYRSTSLDSNFITGNPTIATGSKLQGAVKAIGGTLTNPDYDFSKVDFKNISGLLWFNNAVGLRNLFEIMQHDLPNRSQRE